MWNITIHISSLLIFIHLLCEACNLSSLCILDKKIKWKPGILFRIISAIFSLSVRYVNSAIPLIQPCYSFSSIPVIWHHNYYNRTVSFLSIKNQNALWILLFYRCFRNMPSSRFGKTYREFFLNSLQILLYTISNTPSPASLIWQL